MDPKGDAQVEVDIEGSDPGSLHPYPTAKPCRRRPDLKHHMLNFKYILIGSIVLETIFLTASLFVVLRDDRVREFYLDKKPAGAPGSYFSLRLFGVIAAAFGASKLVFSLTVGTLWLFNRTWTSWRSWRSSIRRSVTTAFGFMYFGH